MGTLERDEVGQDQGESERDYVLDQFNNLVLEDAHDDEREAEAAAEDEEDEEYEDASDGQQSEHYDEDEEEDDVEAGMKDGRINSQLAVGAKVDRSFVVRGDKIGVFKHTPDNHLEFSTAINNVQTTKGKGFAPKKVMLHAGDKDMVLQKEGDPNSLYRMDLEVGKVVDEWKVHDDIPVNVYAPENKFAQTTGEQTFLGLSNNALYRIDPRLSGNKLVDSELKQYTSKNDFSAAATTEQGYIAVASNKGDIRMFDRLGINAKTALPALGDPIIGIDVSADGRWILATTRTYLLLIDALQKEGKNEGKLGFEKAFAKDSKPQPRRLGLTPSHVAQFQHETGADSPSRPRTSIRAKAKTRQPSLPPLAPSSSPGRLRRSAGRRDPYSIKRYSEEVKADNFSLGVIRILWWRCRMRWIWLRGRRCRGLRGRVLWLRRGGVMRRGGVICPGVRLLIRLIRVMIYLEYGYGPWCRRLIMIYDGACFINSKMDITG